jgi:zinc/manganese transport system substrate-binding protein
MRKIALAFLMMLPLVLPVRAADKIHVIASFSILGDMVKQIAGDRAEVAVLVGPNGDAHTFEPLPSDAKKLTDAKLVLVNGLGLDPWMDRLISASSYKGPVVVASKGVEPRTMVEDETGNKKTVTDPHAWQDLSNGVIYISNIVEALSKVDPVNAAQFRAVGDQYIGKLRALDADVRQQIDKVPSAKRRVITSHDAFGYFGGAYGIEFLAPRRH